MRYILAASLMLSSLLFPTVASATTPASDSATAQPIRVSTGVVAPKLIAPINLSLPSELAWQTLPGNATVGLSLTIDENGKAHDVQVTKSLTNFWDARVVEAVEKARYRPATIDRKNIPLTVNLTVSVTR
jgi:TonB family protein